MVGLASVMTMLDSYDERLARHSLINRIWGLGLLGVDTCFASRIQVGSNPTSSTKNMIVVYEDEYGEELLKVTDAGMIPNVGDSVIMEEEDWRVKSRTFYPAQNAVVVSVTQNLVRGEQKSAEDGRLKEVKASILELANKQSATDKKVRAVTEQTVSIRKHINTQIQKDRKNDS